MHPIQKKAIYAMLDAIENQMRYVKSLVLMEDETAAPPMKSSVPKAAQTEYLDEEEELQIERDLEDARLKGKAEQEALAAQWAIQRKIINEEASL